LFSIDAKVPYGTLAAKMVSARYVAVESELILGNAREFGRERCNMRM
jgi:hypothetical protein